MLIDDDEATNFIHQDVLEDVDPEDKDIHVHNDAEEALKNIKKSKIIPEIIFLDINMPGMNGWDFLDEFEKSVDYNGKSIIIVMLTSSLNPDDEKKAKKYKSISGFENKPLTEEKAKKIFAKFF